MLQWLWLIAIPFLAGILLPAQPLISRIAGLGGMLTLAIWGGWMYVRLSRSEDRAASAVKNLTEAREEAGRQKATVAEVSRQRDRLEDLKKEMDQKVARLKYILDSLPAGVILISKKEELVTWCSQGVERIAGYRPDELSGQNFITLFRGGQQVLPAKSRLELLADQKDIELNSDKITVKSGTELEVVSHLWNLPSGDLVGWMFQPRAQAIDYNKLRDEFVTNISHELRTPLTVIKGYAEILYEEARNGGNEQADLIKVIVDEGDRLAGILDSILNFRQASSGMLGLRDEKVDIIALLNTVVHDIEPKAVKKNIKVAKKLPASLSPSRGDFNALRFALSNIVDNAVKFTPEGGNVTVETGGWRLEDAMWKMEIHVIDTGLGIAPEVLPHIFEKFYRTDQKVHTLQGTGIGLSLTKEILETHGGSIHVESTVGKGTKVSVGLPMSE